MKDQSNDLKNIVSTTEENNEIFSSIIVFPQLTSDSFTFQIFRQQIKTSWSSWPRANPEQTTMHSIRHASSELERLAFQDDEDQQDNKLDNKYK